MSVAAHSGLVIPQTLERVARKQLTGVGDPGRGEWTDWSGKAFHLRRRLSVAEEKRTGPAVDIRGTPEAARRLAALGSLASLISPQVLEEEMGMRW